MKKTILKSQSMATQPPAPTFDVQALFDAASRALTQKPTTTAAPTTAVPVKRKMTLGTAKPPAKQTIAEQATDLLRGITATAPAGKIPTDEELKAFFKGRSKHPERYTYDPKGNLQIRSKIGAVEKTYTIPPYRSPTKDELMELETARREAVKVIEGEYDTALEELRLRYDEYKIGEATAGSVKAANQKVEEIDMRRYATMFPLRGFTNVEGIVVNRVLFDQRDNKGTFKEPIAIPRRRALTLQELYSREGQEVIPELPVEPVRGGGEIAGEVPFAQTLADDKGIVAFANPEDNEYGYLSSFWPVEFTLDGVKYFTVEQAVAAEKARAFMEDELRTEILKTRAPRTMRTKANAIIPKSITETNGVPVPRLDEWENEMRPKVLKAATLQKFKQHPDLADKLILTGDKVLVLADTREKRDGIALALTDPKIANSAEWKGPNQYGRILMEVRTALREEREGELGDDADGFEEETISEGGYFRERDRSVRGAAIHAARRY